jgi:hypothetical protein
MDLSKSWQYYDGSYHGEELMDQMVGLVFTRVESNGDELLLECAEGTFRFYHEQDCCESVSIESIVGDLQDLVGTPMLVATASSSEEDPAGYTHEYEPESQTWTFYKFATIKGYVDIRWYGTSNGCYSESVNVSFVPATPEAHNE